MLVVPNRIFGNRVPFRWVPKIWKGLFEAVPIEEIFKLDEKWRQIHITFIASQQMSVGTGQLYIPTTPDLDREEKMLDQNKVSGDIIPSLETIQVQELIRVKCHSKWVHVLSEGPTKGYSEEPMTAALYTELKPGSSRVSVFIKNLTGKTPNIFVTEEGILMILL